MLRGRAEHRENQDWLFHFGGDRYWVSGTTIRGKKPGGVAPIFGWRGRGREANMPPVPVQRGRSLEKKPAPPLSVKMDKGGKSALF